MDLRRLAQFCVVRSLHDGMNLVAKEYVASRFDEDGVLILSPYTGAALELTQALIVNPYATEDFADNVLKAVTMPPLERQWRMQEMRSTIQEKISTNGQRNFWCNSFTAPAAVVRLRVNSCPFRRVSPVPLVFLPHLLSVWPSVVERFNRASRTLLLLD